MMRAVAKAARFVRDRRGVSAVEFALVAPLMITLYFGCVEISDGVAVDRKVSLTAATLANLVAQSTALSADDMTNILSASTAIIQPYSPSNLRMTVSCLNIDANKTVTTQWSSSGSTGAVTAPVLVPDALKVANTQLILAQVSYAYTPIVGYTITGTLTLSDQMFMMPRISAPTYPDANHKCSA